MKTEIRKLAQSKIEILFEIPWEDFQSFLDKAISKIGANVKLKGFRPGKAPKEIIEKEIGEEKALTEAAELAIRQRYPEFVAEKELEVIGSPKIEILKLARGNPFSFRVEVDVLPEIKLPDYKKIALEVEKKEVSVEDKDIEETLNWLRNSRAKFEDLDREAKNGDFLEIEYQSPQIAALSGEPPAFSEVRPEGRRPAGRENGKVFQDGFLLGKGHFIPGFEENLQGMKSGEEKEFTAIFHGKKAAFKVKVKKVQLMELPELNDDFAKSLGRFENLEALKENLKQGIKKEKEIEEIQRRREEILEKIVENSEFEIPQALIDLEKDRKRINNFLILRAIGKKERVEVSEEEIREAVNGFLKNYSSAEKAKKETIDLDKLKEYYQGVIYNEKVMQLLTKASPKGEA